ncbi:MAG: sugar ABC transporter ATP-binding protein [Bacilli bacterium]
MKEKYILEINGLSKSFGKNQVLKNISLNVKPATILGLMGENGAGKSTMMKCLFGIYGMDAGSVILDGKAVSFSGPKEALENGIAMVHQELNQCLDRTVLDNMFLGRYIGSCGLVNEGVMLAKCKQIFADLDMDVNPKTIMRTMSVSQRQMVEIAKAVSYNSKIIVLDEPTSSLSEREVKKLFKIIRDLKAKKNISFIFISHKMDEIFDLCDDVVILRDGAVTLDKHVKDTNLDELVKAMVGRSLDNRFPPLTNKPGEVILKVKNLCTKYTPHLKDISFELKKGEILGIYGLVGAGRSELLETLFGARTMSEGEIVYKGKRISFKNTKEAMDTNFAFITEERKVNGIYYFGDLVFNTCITNLDKYKKGGILSDSEMKKATDKEIALTNVKCNGRKDLIKSLSGGNQQKVIVGKWLERQPDLFLMDEPTRGIDIMAKYQIYETMIRLANEGKSIIMVSSEMPEILGVTNRIVVMSNYRVAGIVNTKDTNQEELLRLCAKNL